MKEQNKFDNQKLDVEEQALSESLERGEWVSVKKEQVSVDKEEYEMLKKVFSAWNELQNRQSKSKAFGIVKSELERLKRLDENRIKKVASLKAVMALNSKTKSYSEDEIALIDDVIILLESLDK